MGHLLDTVPMPAHIARLPRNAHPLYELWRGVLRRCSDPRATGYANYGGRGITVYQAWRESFDRFVADLPPRPSPLHTLDRIDNDGHYEPGNVRWASQDEQHRNMRTNRLLQVGDEVRTMRDWSTITGISTSTMCNRINRGWSDEAVITTPTQRKADDNTLFPPGGRQRCIELGLNVYTVASRLRRGWSLDAAITTPVDKRRASKARKAS